MLKSEVHAEPKAHRGTKHRCTASPSMDTDLFKLELLALQALRCVGQDKQTQRAPAREPSFLTHVLMFGTRV